MRRAFLLPFLFSLGLPAFAQSAAVHYTITDLGPVGGPPGQPFAIKNNGLIVGSAAVSPTALHAVLWFHDMKVDIAGSGGAGNSVAFGANDWGQIVGEIEGAGNNPYGEDFCGFGTSRNCQPFLWQFGMMTRLPMLKDAAGVSGLNAAANSINNRGQIVGVAENTTRDTTCPPLNPAAGQSQIYQFKPVMWENGTARALPTIAGDPDGIAFAINESGQAVGGSGTCTAFQSNGDLTYLYSRHATMWHDGTVTDLGNLGGVMPGGGNTAININNRSQVVGSSGTSDGSFHGFLWSWQTGIQDLGTVGDDVASVALGLNDRGDVTGISFDADFNPRAYVRPAGGKMIDLNSVSSGAPLFLFDACSINSRGEIIGIAVDAAGEFHGYMASPGSSTAGKEKSIGEFEHARNLLRHAITHTPFGLRPPLPR